MKSSKAFNTLLIVALCLSAVINALLAREVWRQRGLLSALHVPTALKVGEAVASATGVDLQHNAVTITPHSPHGTILYVFSPSCHWCQQNRRNVDALAPKALEQGYRIYGISLAEDGLAAFLEKTRQPYPVVIATAEMRAAYHLAATPNMIVLTAGGLVEKNWRGAWTGSTADAIQSFFTCSLPGLAIPEGTNDPL